MPTQEIRIPIVRRHYTLRSTGETEISAMDYNRQWMYAETEEYICCLQDDGTWRRHGQHALLRPGATLDEAVIVGANGCVGLDVEPSQDWIANTYAIEFNRGIGPHEPAIFGHNGSLYLSQNIIYDATDARLEYRVNAIANLIRMTATSMDLLAFASGAAGGHANDTATTTNDLRVDSVIGTIVNVTQGDHNFVVYWNNAVPAIFVEGGDGSIGLGTVAPSTNLHIYENNASTTPQIFIEQDGSGDASIEFDWNGNAWTIGVDHPSDNPVFKISPGSGLTDTNYFCVDNTGCVGIGVAVPNNLLEVYSSTAHPVIIVNADHASNYDPMIQFVTLSDTISIGVDGANSHFKIVNGNNVGDSTEFVFDDNGNFGIGTDTFQAACVSNIAIAEGTAPGAATADQCYIWAQDDAGTAEAYVQDGAGNQTSFSPHNKDGEWEYFSRNIKTGKTVRINMEKLVKFIDEKFNTNFLKTA